MSDVTKWKTRVSNGIWTPPMTRHTCTEKLAMQVISFTMVFYYFFCCGHPKLHIRPTILISLECQVFANVTVQALFLYVGEVQLFSLLCRHSSQKHDATTF